MPKRKISVVWDFFEDIVVIGGFDDAYCAKNCGNLGGILLISRLILKRAKILCKSSPSITLKTNAKHQEIKKNF